MHKWEIIPQHQGIQSLTRGLYQVGRLHAAVKERIPSSRRESGLFGSVGWHNLLVPGVRHVEVRGQIDLKEKPVMPSGPSPDCVPEGLTQSGSNCQKPNSTGSHKTADAQSREMEGHRVILW